MLPPLRGAAHGPVLGGLGFALAAGLGAGLLARSRPRAPLRRGFDLASGVALSLPVYWMGFVVLMLVASGSGMLVQLPFVSGAGRVPDDDRVRTRGPRGGVRPHRARQGAARAPLYGLIVWGCLLIAIANVAVDVLQSRLDPRVGAAMRRG